MSSLDWIVLAITLCGIILFGVWKSRGQKNLDSYFLGNQSMPAYIVLFSIIGTQASAITFLSAPGQAYTDGMRFVQYYFGLPLAMVILCVTFVPIFHRLKVYTAYEYLEQRFDVKTRHLASFLFLLQRGLSTGISIYAPSLILSSLLGWDIYLTNVILGGLLIIYTVSGGTKAISYTQTQQLVIIFGAMFLAGYMVIHILPAEMNFTDVLKIAGKSGKLNVITTGFTDTGFNWKDKYNIFSGVIGGFFLALSYFGTDQSQVGRYLTASSIKESRKGLLMNGLIKIPMQFLILLVGVLVFTFYCTFQGPVYYNTKILESTYKSEYGNELKFVEGKYHEVQDKKRAAALGLIAAGKNENQPAYIENSGQLKSLESEALVLRKDAAGIIHKANPSADVSDTNYIFLHFVIANLPKGLVGLIIAIIFLAAWGSIAAALNSLASCSVIDWHHRIRQKERSESRDLKLSRYYTFAWGIFSIVVAQIAGQMGSLIEAVNILGSLFYGTILGIFVIAFYLKHIQGNAVFYSAVLTECLVIFIYVKDVVSFLWLNAIGCILAVLIALVLQVFLKKSKV